MSDENIVVIRRYRPHGEIEAFRYDGGFPLNFLRGDEKVCADGGMGDAKVLIPGANPDLPLRPGCYVIRESNGQLRTMGAKAFEESWTPSDLDMAVQRGLESALFDLGLSPDDIRERALAIDAREAGA